MNFFPVELQGDDAIFSEGGAPAPLDAAARDRLKTAAGKGVFGVRPEHFEVVATESSGIPIQIKLVEPLGSDTLIHFDLAGTSAIARVDPSLKPKPGERLFLRPQAGKTHLFEAATGRVLP
jgi:multiple sugar transport system ATP-binding protein